MRTPLLVCVVLGAATASYAEAVELPLPIVVDEFIFEQAQFASSHASTIVETEEGLLAAWFGGSDEGEPDVGIWTSRRGADGWSAPVEVVDGVVKEGERYPCWNPVLFQPKEGPLLLFYKVGPSPRAWWGMLMTSEDQGRTWSTPVRLPEGILGPIKNKPVQLANGDIVSGTSTEHDGWRVHFERSTDGGQTWEATAAIEEGPTRGAIQPSVLVHSDGRLQSVGRTGGGFVFQTWSEDDGRTWGEMTSLGLPNPNAGTDAVTLADGRHVLVYNHTTRGRSPLNVAVSDDGVAWRAAAVLIEEPGSEFSYPAVIQARDGMVHVTYTWKRERVKHVVLDPAKLDGEPIVEGKWPGR